MTFGAQRALVRPLLPLDPPFQHVVQVDGTDDLLVTDIEVGRVEEEGLSLRPTEAAVVADQLFERGDLSGEGIDAADDEDVRYVDEFRLAPEMPRRVRAELDEGVFTFDAPVAQDVRPILADRQRSPLLGVDQHQTDARVGDEPRDKSRKRFAGCSRVIRSFHWGKEMMPRLLDARTTTSVALGSSLIGMPGSDRSGSTAPSDMRGFRIRRRTLAVRVSPRVASLNATLTWPVAPSRSLMPCSIPGSTDGPRTGFSEPIVTDGLAPNWRAAGGAALATGRGSAGENARIPGVQAGW